jgi:hypothetical protein
MDVLDRGARSGPSSWHSELRLPGKASAAAVALVLACLAIAWGMLAPGVSPAAAQDQKPPLDEPAAPVRVTIPSLGIDLPVVSSEQNVPGNVRGYPLCDVAQYWTRYDLPGAPGTAWVYAHAQPGMFLPMLLRAEATNGDGLLGTQVLLQLRDGRLLRYRIDEVKQRAYNQAIAQGTRPREQRLILQTSEGPPGTPTRLQVAATLVSAAWTDEAAPRPEPRACWQPRPAQGGKRPRPSATPAPADGQSGQLMDTAALVMGGGAVLLGATLLAVYLVRRPPPDARRRR